MRTLMIALALACVPFAAAAQEGGSAKPVPAAAVREAAKVQRPQRSKPARPAWQAALRSPEVGAARKQKDPAAPQN